MYTNKNKNLNSFILEVPATIHKQIMEYRKSIFVGYQKCRVFDIINTKPCANCAGFRHNSNKCRNAVTYLICAGEHKTVQCDSRNNLKCANCAFSNLMHNTKYDCNHEATDSDTCNIFKNKIRKYIASVDYLIKPNQITEKFNMSNAHEVCTPLDPQSKLELFEKDETLNNIPYKEAIGSLMSLAMITRPDISYSVGVLSRYADKPKRAHWNGIKRVIKCIKGTSNYGLFYGRNDSSKNVKIVAYSDADFAGDNETRKSTSGCVIKLGQNLISWSFRKQQTVALSTTESEFIAA